MSAIEILERTSVQTAVVAARGLGRRYGLGPDGIEALRDVSLEIPRGRLTAIVGGAGAGKATLDHRHAGRDRPTSGSVSIEGVELTSLSAAEVARLRRRHTGFVFRFFTERADEVTGRGERIALARALAAQPTVLFADDVSLESARLIAASGRTAVIATRDAEAAAVADLVVVLAAGEVVHAG
jgi:putative ABC transport system ATP-binding protein